MADGDAHGLAREEVHNRFGMSAIDCQQQRDMVSVLRHI
jgi:hypothetical protein